MKNKASSTAFGVSIPHVGFPTLSAVHCYDHHKNVATFNLPTMMMPLRESPAPMMMPSKESSPLMMVPLRGLPPPRHVRCNMVQRMPHCNPICNSRILPNCQQPRIFNSTIINAPRFPLPAVIPHFPARPRVPIENDIHSMDINFFHSK